jgi:hypothetical protein
MEDVSMLEDEKPADLRNASSGSDRLSDGDLSSSDEGDLLSFDEDTPRALGDTAITRILTG